MKNRLDSVNGSHIRMCLRICIIAVCCVSLAVIAVLAGFFIRPSPIVLMYHSVSDAPVGGDDVLSVRVAEFDAQMAFIAEKGLITGFVGEDCDIVVTFDDGYADNFTSALPILKKYNIKATIFAAASLIGKDGYLTVEQLFELCESGLVSVQSHGLSHTRFDMLNAEELKFELAESKRIIEATTNREVYALSYPEGGYNKAVEAAVKSAGYEYAFTTKTPNIYRGFDDFAIPRSGVPRGLSEKDFSLLHTIINFYELYN